MSFRRLPALLAARVQAGLRFVWAHRPFQAEQIDPTWADALRKRPACTFCGGWHLGSCPRVKRIVFGDGGNPREIEFWATWPTDKIVFPDELPPLEAASGPTK